MGPAPARRGAADRGLGATGGSYDGARVVIPSRGGDGKSRLIPPPGVSRTDLARAMALDTLATALACPLVSRVTLVTADASLAGRARSLGGARLGVVEDPGGGLNEAIATGLTACAPPAVAAAVAVLLGDLPALRPDELTAALIAWHEQSTTQAQSARQSARHGAGHGGASYVADHCGTGTVLLMGAAPEDLRPQFGPDSAARHGRFARRLDLDLPGLQLDVDDAADLAMARQLGVGPATRATLARAMSPTEP